MAGSRSPGTATREQCRLPRRIDVIAIVDHLALQRPVLVGQSLGGHTAMLTAAAHPGLVRALVLVEAGPGRAPDGGQRVRRSARCGSRRAATRAGADRHVRALAWVRRECRAHVRARATASIGWAAHQTKVPISRVCGRDTRRGHGRQRHWAYPAVRPPAQARTTSVTR
ncbi:alpha/beta fold hydrolase [Streptomyces sennicomposti]